MKLVGCIVTDPEAWYGHVACACIATELEKLRAVTENARKAMQHFIDKVHSGKARSVESYGQFKEVLAQLTALDHKGKEGGGEEANT